KAPPSQRHLNRTPYCRRELSDWLTAAMRILWVTRERQSHNVKVNALTSDLGDGAPQVLREQSCAAVPLFPCQLGLHAHVGASVPPTSPPGRSPDSDLDFPGRGRLPTEMRRRGDESFHTSGLRARTGPDAQSQHRIRQ